MTELTVAPPTPASRHADPQVVVLELSAGRWDGGHHVDYLQALLDALGHRRPEVRAPYLERAAPTGRVARRLHDLRAVWRTFAPSRETRIVVIQSPSPWEILFLRLTTTLRRGRLPVAVAVLRRTDEIERGLGRIRAALARRAVDHLITSGKIWPASDSPQGLAALEQRTGVRGTRIPIPPLAGAGRAVPTHDGPVVALLGAFRAEKGAEHYDAVIAAALDTMPDCVVDVQIGAVGARDGSAGLASALVARWSAHPRVRIHGGYVSREMYVGLLEGADVVVLPYDVALYGTGTSGVLHEALVVGCTVVATPIAWAAAEHGSNPRAVFIDSVDDDVLCSALPQACADAVRRRGERGGAVEENGFAGAWQEAVSAAELLLERRER